MVQGRVDEMPVPRLQRAMALLTLGVSICGATAVAVGYIDFTGWRAVASSALLLGCIPLAVLVVRSQFDTTWWTPQSVLGVPVGVLYVIGSDVTETIFLLTFRNYWEALFGAFLMGLTSAYAGLVGQRSVAITHIAVSSAAFVGIGTAAVLRGDATFAATLPLVLVLLLVVNGPVLPVNKFMREIHHFVHTHYELSSRDPLTGLLNRRGLALEMQERLAAPGGQLVAVVTDIDHFKLVNDAHGHQVGDTVLKLFASRLQSVVGFDGVTARIGGEEFCAVFVSSDTDVVKKHADRLVRVSNNEADDVPVTVSVGVASLVFDAETRAHVALREVMRRADHALYLAKAAGRNRMVAVD